MSGFLEQLGENQRSIGTGSSLESGDLGLRLTLGREESGLVLGVSNVDICRCVTVGQPHGELRVPIIYAECQDIGVDVWGDARVIQ